VDDRKFATPQMVDDAAREFELLAGAPDDQAANVMSQDDSRESGSLLQEFAKRQDRIRERPSVFVQTKERIL